MLEAGKHEAAAARCEAVFHQAGDPQAGLAAALARRALGDADGVRAWAHRLEGTAEEAGAWGLFGALHQERGELGAAREAYQRQMELQRQAGLHAEAAKTSYRLFYLSWQEADYRGAFEFASEAVREAAAAGDRDLQAQALDALYVALYEAGDLEGAKRALDQEATLLGPERHLDRARLLVHRGLILLHQDRPSLARDAFERGLKLGRAGEDPGFFRSTHLNLVKANLAVGDLARAEEHLKAAWEHAPPQGERHSGLLYYQARVDFARGRYGEALAALNRALAQQPDPAWVRDLEYQRGLVEETRGNLPSAEEAYGRAADLVEEMRGELALDDLKAWLLDAENNRRPFEALFLLQARSGRHEAALATVEKATARAFLEAFVQATAEPEEPRPEGAAATGAMDRFEALGVLLPAMSASPIVALRPLERVLESLRDRNILVYLEARDEVWLIAVAERRIRCLPLGSSQASVEDLTDRFLAHLDEEAAASALSQVLLPEGSLPAPGSTLYVVPDGKLGRLPFAALRRGERFLVEDYPITYVPSLNALAVIPTRPATPVWPPVVLADPRTDLPGAAREGREVGELLGVPPRIGEAASLERLREASRAEVLHLASHTGLGPRGPWLALADGEMGAGEIVTGGLGPRLVVLAGCASGARRGRGLWGSLGAAFLAAGSQAVLASLWSVPDDATRAFVLRFYGEGGVIDPTQALARAQRALIAAGEPPSVWAPFVVFGSAGHGQKGR